MRGRINDGLRCMIGLLIDGLGLAFEIIHRLRIATFAYSQKRLRMRYRIHAETPILPYGPETEQSIHNAAAQYDTAVYAETSGSTAAPKRILYTKRRLRSASRTFIDAFVRCYRAYGIRRKSLYVFSAFDKDNSLSSMLLEEKRLPSYLVTLQAPYRVEKHPAIRSLSLRYGSTAVRLWIMAIANPGVLYSTNPSTLWLFLHEIETDWQRSRQLIRDYRNNPDKFDVAIHAIAKRLDSRGSTERMSRIAAADDALPLSACAPAVGAYVCWTGGYVKPFLDRIATHLAADRRQLIPMYSMSTETIETISHFGRSTAAFLPMAKGVLYEFIEEGAPDTPQHLVTPDQLQPMKAYSMAVSDPYGLRRYQTEDLFLCTGFAGRLPDLRFLRRRNLEYSFTGEKVTSEQLALVFERLRGERAELPSDAFLTCTPSHPNGDSLPCYMVILVCGSDPDVTIHENSIASRCDTLLQEVNSEYRDKRSSGRLAAMRFAQLSFDEFVPHQDNQFKFLPLYRRTGNRRDRFFNGPKAV